MVRAWCSEAKPPLAGGTLEGASGFWRTFSHKQGRVDVRASNVFVIAYRNHLKILDVSPIGLKILYLISSRIIYTSR